MLRKARGTLRSADLVHMPYDGFRIFLAIRVDRPTYYLGKVRTVTNCASAHGPCALLQGAWAIALVELCHATSACQASHRQSKHRYRAVWDDNCRVSKDSQQFKSKVTLHTSLAHAGMSLHRVRTYKNLYYKVVHFATRRFMLRKVLV